MRLLKKIYEKKREKNEKLRKKVLSQVFKALEDFSKEVSFSRAYIFGSLVKPYKFSEKSDVDLAFEDLDREKFLYAIAFFSSYLEREVDVVELERVKFKEKIKKEAIIWKKN